MAGNVKINEKFTLGNDFTGQNLDIVPDTVIQNTKPSVNTPVLNPVSPSQSGSYAQGPKGDTGEKGEKGDTGEKGATGETGANGTNGVDGRSIEFSWDTSNGMIKLGVRLEGDTEYSWSPDLKGAQGIQGIQGIQGVQGAQGIQGETGPQGETGATGETGPSSTPMHQSITLPSNSTVQGRCDNAIEGTDYPTGWIISASTNPNDIKIVHTLTGMKCALCFVYSVSGGVETILLNNAAFSCVKNLADGSVEINGLATITTQLKIYLIFM